MSITYPVYIPVPIKSSRFGLNINQSRFAGEFVRNRITQSHGAGTTDRWEGVYTTPVLSPAQHREMSAWLDAMSVDDGTFYAYNPDARSLNGSFDDNNLLGATAEAEHSLGALTYFYTDNGGVDSGGAVHGQILSSFGLKAGDIISVAADVKFNTGSGPINILVRFIDDTDTLVGSSFSGNGVTTLGVYGLSKAENITIPAGATSIEVRTNASGTALDRFSKNAILNKAATSSTFVPFLKINGASQTGTIINIKDCPVSTNGILMPGDSIQIANQFHEVKTRVDSDASGLAAVDIMPAIRTSPPDSDPVIVRNPVCISQLVKTNHPQDTNHNSTGVISFAWQEKL